MVYIDFDQIITRNKRNMKLCTLALFLAALCTAQAYEFPENFKFGVATASYQVEGGWDANGKGENIWDHLTHNNPDFVRDQSNGDVACDTYNKAKEDVQLLRALGVNFYRFSFSWSRILPTGHANQINPDGIRYYNELIDELVAYNITPLATMFHWDLPQPLHEIGGWPNEILADLFADYSQVLYDNFGDRIKDWITFNEPYQMCASGYSLGGLAPAYKQDGIGGYLCAHTLLLAHAKAYRLYDEYYREIQQGRVGITLDSSWYEPESDSVEDEEAALMRLRNSFGWFANPIFSETGDYPQMLRERVDKASEEEGYPRSRLPTFTQEQVEYIKGTSDFFGLNHYTTSLCTPLDDSSSVARPSHTYDMGASCYQPWQETDSIWIKTVPWGFRKLLNWIKEEYNSPEIMVTENGYAYSSDNQLSDCRRAFYYNSYLEALLEAMYEDDCNITAYTAWSFMDNFEWSFGYSVRFGLYFVDFEDPDRARTPKLSSFAYRNIIQTRQVDWDFTGEGYEACVW